MAISEVSCLVIPIAAVSFVIYSQLMFCLIIAIKNSVIRNMLRFEKSLDVCLNRLEERYRDLHPEIDWSTHDEIESIASASGSYPASSITSRVRFGVNGQVGQERKAEKLRTKVISLETENQKLRQQLQQMEKLMKLQNRDNDSGKEEKKGQDEGSVAMTEGEVWNLVRSS